MKPPAFLIFLAVLTLLPACEREPAPTAFHSETLPGGAVQTTNPEQGAWTKATRWKAVEDLRIGTADGVGPDVLAGPAALEVDRAGHLYVLDVLAMNVRVFGPNGRHQRTMGRKGGGPGELAQPAGMTLAPDGAVWVVDPGNARYTIFDSSGTPRASVPRNSRFSMMPWPGRFDSQGRVWDVDAPSAPGKPNTLLRIDPASGGTERIQLPPVPRQEFTTINGNVSSTVDVPFSPRLAWTIDRDGHIWSANTGHYRLVQRNQRGDSLRIVTRVNTPVPVSAAERDSVPLQLKWFTDQGGRIDVSKVPRNKPALEAISTDDRGWLWVQPSVRGGEQTTPLDVFDPQGRYHGRLTLPVLSFVPPLIRGQHIYVVVVSDEGVPQVVRYRIDGRPAA